jgi:hypothetical protein
MRGPRRLVNKAAFIGLAAFLAACSASSSSFDVSPHPTPAVTVVVRLAGSGASSVELIGTGVAPEELGRLAPSVAGTMFGDDAVGPASAVTSGDAGSLTVHVPVAVSDQGFEIPVASGALDRSFSELHLRTTDVWICTDRVRTIQVASAWPGAVTSDVESGVCQHAGESSRGADAWSATVSVGPVGEASNLPQLLVTLFVVLAVVGLVLLIRSRRPRPPPDRPVEA